VREADRPDRRLQLSVEGEGEDRTLRLAGELDIAEAPQLERVLGELTAQAARVEIDMSELSFMDSTGLRAILRCCEGGGDCRVRASNLHPQVARLVELAGVGARAPFARDD
jgi:anti-anti-sigma factor